MPTLTITRTFEPITKTIDDCRDCPYFTIEYDIGFKLSRCMHPKYDNMGMAYETALDCRPTKTEGTPPYIAPLCPELPK